MSQHTDDDVKVEPDAAANSTLTIKGVPLVWDPPTPDEGENDQ